MVDWSWKTKKCHFAEVSDGEIKKPWALSSDIPAAERGLFTKYEIWCDMDTNLTGIRQPVDSMVFILVHLSMGELK